MATSDFNKNVQNQNLELRTSIADAYSFVEGQKSVQSFTAVTFEDLVDQQIERIEGKGTTTRPNMLTRVDQLEARLKASVDKLKKLPAEAFSQTDPENDVNTPPEGDAV